MRYEDFESNKTVLSGLYAITNLINGKRYVGKSYDIYRRWRKHVKDDGRFAIHAAFNKYGLENFDFSVLVVAPDNEYLVKLETDAIAAFNTVSPNGYNLTLGGEGGKLILACEETRMKHKATVSSEEFKAKISRSSKSRWENDEFRSKRIADLRTIGATKEFKKSCSDASKANWSNPEYVAKMQAIQGSEEHREVLRERSLGMWADPTYRAKMVAKTHSCFWCGIDTTKGHYNQHHGDKCEYSPYNNYGYEIKEISYAEASDQ